MNIGNGALDECTKIILNQIPGGEALPNSSSLGQKCVISTLSIALTPMGR